MGKVLAVQPDFSFWPSLASLLVTPLISLAWRMHSCYTSTLNKKQVRLALKTPRSRLPAGYDGSRPTSRKLETILGHVVQQITHSVEERPDLILAAWPEILGAQFAGMTEAVSFHDQVLVVKVKTATLYSLLAQREKGKILASLRKRFPKVTVSNIVFRRS